MKKRTKILMVFAAYFCLLIFDGCSNPDDGHDCPNTSPPPFYDFQSLVIAPNQNEISNGQQLELILQLDELNFLTFHQPKSSFGLVSKAYGCSPLPAGYDGPKFPIENIEITSNQNFNSSYPANTSLNELVLLQNYNETTPLNEADMTQLNFDGYEIMEPKSIIIEAIPDELEVEHIFTIKITKSNGVIIENSTSEIIWK